MAFCAAQLPNKASHTMIKLVLVTLSLLSALTLTAASQAVIVGAERTAQYQSLLLGKRLALVVNQSSRVGDQHLVDYLRGEGHQIVRVLAPEHGFRGNVGAGERIDDSVDSRTGIPIMSLYGAHRKPTAAMLADIDYLLVDLQDVGTRFYTYLSTLHYAIEAAAEQRIPVLIFDRPNPNGAFIDGPVLEPEFRSFVGMHEIPLLHGMTLGELALMIVGEGWINAAAQADVKVIGMQDYQRQQRYELPVPPSPNLPNSQAIQLYPSLCLFEATAMSIGRGTDFPFQVLGHDQVHLGEFSFTPKSLPHSAPTPKLQDQQLYGIDLRNSAMSGFDLSLLIAAHNAFQTAQIRFFTSPDFMDKLSGTDKLRLAIEAGLSAEQIRAQWQPQLDAFKQLRQQYLLYPD
jgi:uncharacterized protein YbbC (DUF1343 family)